MLVLETWQDGNGVDECFVGNMTTYLPLHSKPTLEYLRGIWGSYKVICMFKIDGRTPEFKTKVAFNHPDNVPEPQIAWKWQPIDDIRVRKCRTLTVLANAHFSQSTSSPIHLKIIFTQLPC